MVYFGTVLSIIKPQPSENRQQFTMVQEESPTNQQQATMLQEIFIEEKRSERLRKRCWKR